MTAIAKTIDDLPHLRVSAIKRSETRETDFELSGVFDRPATVREGPCSLLVPGKDVLIALSGDLRFQDPAAGTALFQTSDESMPEVVGLDLTYVDTKWKPHHVWMVAEPRWKWNRTLFHAIDAIARIVEGNGVSVIDGEEVGKWIEIKENGKSNSLSRYYPVFPSGKTALLSIGPDGIIQGGWDHAHCELCDAHIDAENYGYLDLGEHWACEGCYTKYVVNHDLSFLQT
jgi:hypothetical protein